jgi:ADP-ribose pyrophosphatase YjhB (NUDIX family)
VQCVGGVITDDSGRLLLILRGHDPGKGLWSIPGGRVEPSESDAQAVVREMREETGLIVTCGPLLGAVERPGLGGAVVDIRDYRAVVTGGELAPGDDADAARWVTAAEAAEMEAAGQLTGGLLETLSGWSVFRW